MMTRLNRNVLRTGLLATVAATVGVAAAAAMAGSQAPARAPAGDLQAARAKLDAVKRYAGQSDPLVRAAGADPADARAVGHDDRGVTISTVEGRGARCVLISDGASFCATPEQVRRGQSLHVRNDCSRSEGDMRITVVLPPGAVGAALVDSAGASAPMTVAGGVAWIDSRTPADGDTTPVEIRARDRRGRALPAIPVPGGFCPGN
jgi:hypothetical protein